MRFVNLDGSCFTIQTRTGFLTTINPQIFDTYGLFSGEIVSTPQGDGVILGIGYDVRNKTQLFFALNKDTRPDGELVASSFDGILTRKALQAAGIKSKNKLAIDSTFQIITNNGVKTTVDTQGIQEVYGLIPGELVYTENGPGFVLGQAKFPENDKPQLAFALLKDVRYSQLSACYWSDITPQSNLLDLHKIQPVNLRVEENKIESTASKSKTEPQEETFDPKLKKESYFYKTTGDAKFKLFDTHPQRPSYDEKPEKIQKSIERTKKDIDRHSLAYASITNSML